MAEFIVKSHHNKVHYANKKEILAGVSVSIHNAADSSLIKADVSGDEGTFAITIPSQKEVLVYFNLVGIQPTWMRIAAEQSAVSDRHGNCFSRNSLSPDHRSH